MERFAYLGLEYPLGCIIAKATITDCLYVDETLRNELKAKNEDVYHNVLKDNKDWTGYGFKLENVVEIKPIYINGKLSLWDYDYQFDKK